jgi:hypothetical protein
MLTKEAFLEKKPRKKASLKENSKKYPYLGSQEVRRI